MKIQIKTFLTSFILVIFSSISFAAKSNLFSAGVPSLAPMLENVTPAVVNIYTISETEDRSYQINDPFLRKFLTFQVNKNQRKEIGRVLALV